MQKVLSKRKIRKLFPRREKDACKNDFGHALIIAGSRGMTGAAVLAARAALRMGIGLVTVACPESIYPIIAAQVAELMTLPLPETEKQSLSFLAFSQIKDFIARRKISVLAVGPGLSTHPETKKLVKNLLSLELPIILDADGINALEKQIADCRLQIADLKKAKAKIIITPHPGEFARLLNEDKEKIQKNRIVYAKNFARENRIVCILKSYHTIITDGKEVFVNPTGNPGMATAGSGDVLTGMITGLIPQIKNQKSPASLREAGQAKIKNILFEAAKVGVYLHGMAGDLAAKEKTEISLIAGDIIEKIPEAIKAVRKLRS